MENRKVIKDTHNIIAKGIRVNNLKNIDVEIPRNKITVITGLSGSGKSSLAFDTIYAEGQRRYVESLSAYARQFIGRMAKPEADMIKGLPPAIAIEQKVTTRNPRSTVGTTTEIYDYLRLLYGRIGRTIDPLTGEEVKKHSANDVVDFILSKPENTKIAISVPISVPEERHFITQLDIHLKGGYTRLLDSNGSFKDIQDLISAEIADADSSKYELLIDRLAVSYDPDEKSRLYDSIETAFFEGHDFLNVSIYSDSGVERHSFSKKFEASGRTFPEPTEQMFNFNNPYGACPRCEGFGKILGIDERLVIPDPSLSIFDDAVACWKGPKMSEWKNQFIRAASKHDFPIHRPYMELSEEQKKMLWNGIDDFSGIDGFFKMVERNFDKIQYRVMAARYRGKTVCPDCKGSRLRQDAAHVYVGGKRISELVKMQVNDLILFFDNITLNDRDFEIAERILTEIKSRLKFLSDVGLEYLTLDRASNTLSGGESQRINLATQLGSCLMGSLYILDEPSIGLHSRDTDRLISVLKTLRDLGNTVVIVEHDEDIMKEADWLIDVGPDAGSNGGRIVCYGSPQSLPKSSESYTTRYLNGELKIPVPKTRRKWRDYIKITGGQENNLKNIEVKFPLGVMTAVSGVSGSGKSTLVRDILYRSLARHLGESVDAPGKHKGISGDISRIHAVEFVDQNPIGRSTRSNPATYLKAYDEIRKLFSEQHNAKQMGFGPGYFSFNAEGGRCEECKGEGKITIEMQFMADITVTCEECHGQRFKKDVLDVRYRDKNITDVLDMTVDEAIDFFSESSGLTEKKIVRRLQPLKDVGLGYIKLGQSSSTLSGGENQRVKLAYYLGMDKNSPTMFIFDEPTTGLHFHDIRTLLDSFNRLIEAGHSIVIIEHNLDVIKCADHVIDIGPEGGEKGGYVVATGTPEEIAACEESYTGKYLRAKL
ncbi:MAG: excinuclease ABC subunit UvrA [Paramuribaculum sp.]|nr:excinuclease ABC subunit UvrA [Paramuribaculum sp.]